MAQAPDLRSTTMFGVLFLPDFALQVALRHRAASWREQPAAVLAGETRPVLLQVNAAARKVGVQPGMTSSQGLARCGELRVLPRSPAQEASASEALLEIAFACSPWVERTAEGVCTFERRDSHVDDAGIGQRAIAHLARLGFHARAGFARNADLALLAAHAAEPLLVVHDSRAFLGGLPIAALNPSRPVCAILAKWGIETLGALSALPHAEVIRRLGPEGSELWERAAGRAERLLRLASPIVTYEEAMEFDFDVQTLEPLLFILRRFIEQLVLRLQTIYQVPGILRLRLRFDDGQEHSREFRIPAPTGNVETLFRVVHTHLENFTAPASVASLHLSASPAYSPNDQFQLFEAALRDPNRFSETMARLYALFGTENAGVICREDSHRPDAFTLQAPEFTRPASGPEDGREPPAFGLPLRRCRPPVALEVEVSAGVPVWIRCEQAAGGIRTLRGPYQLAGGWWDAQASWTHEEWDVELAEGGLYRLSRQEGRWFLEGVYD